MKVANGTLTLALSALTWLCIVHALTLALSALRQQRCDVAVFIASIVLRTLLHEQHMISSTVVGLCVRRCVCACVRSNTGLSTETKRGVRSRGPAP
jgi:hypothetical protein